MKKRSLSQEKNKKMLNPENNMRGLSFRPEEPSEILNLLLSCLLTSLYSEASVIITS